MIMCVLLCYPVSIHMSQLPSTGRPISSFSWCFIVTIRLQKKQFCVYRLYLNFYGSLIGNEPASDMTEISKHCPSITKPYIFCENLMKLAAIFQDLEHFNDFSNKWLWWPFCFPR